MAKDQRSLRQSPVNGSNIPSAELSKCSSTRETLQVSTRKKFSQYAETSEVVRGKRQYAETFQVVRGKHKGQYAETFRVSTRKADSQYAETTSFWLVRGNLCKYAEIFMVSTRNPEVHGNSIQLILDLSEKPVVSEKSSSQKIIQYMENLVHGKIKVHGKISTWKN